MGTITGILATFAVAHLGGSAVAGILTRFGLLGFGRRVKIARHTLRIGKALAAAYQYEPTEQTKNELKRWLAQHDPQNVSKLGNGLESEMQTPVS